MQNQALFSSKDKSKKLKCRLLQILFGALRVNLSIFYFILQSVFRNCINLQRKKRKKKRKKCTAASRKIIHYLTLTILHISYCFRILIPGICLANCNVE